MGKVMGKVALGSLLVTTLGVTVINTVGLYRHIMGGKADGKINGKTTKPEATFKPAFEVGESKGLGEDMWTKGMNNQRTEATFKPAFEVGESKGLGEDMWTREDKQGKSGEDMWTREDKQGKSEESEATFKPAFEVGESKGLEEYPLPAMGKAPSKEEFNGENGGESTKKRIKLVFAEPFEDGQFDYTTQLEADKASKPKQNSMEATSASVEMDTKTAYNKLMTELEEESKRV